MEENRNKERFLTIFSVIGIISFVLIIGVFLLKSGKIMGYDGFYHIKKAFLMRTEGFKAFNNNEFAFSVLANNPTDHEMLLHLIQAPFTLIKNLATALNLYVIFSYAALGVATFLFLKSQKIKFSLFWTLIMLVGSKDLLFRASLGRAPVLSIALWLLLLYLIINKKYLWQFVFAFFYLWFYGDFLFIGMIAVLYSLAVLVTERKLEWKNILMVVGGLLAGLIVNPFFPKNIQFYIWHFSIPYATIPKGGEWGPINLPNLFRDSFLPLVSALFGTLALFLTRKQKPLSLFLFMMALAFFLLTNRSQRFVEILIPMAVLFGASSLSDFLKESELDKFLEEKVMLRRFVAICALFFVIALGWQNLNGEKDFIENERNVARYKGGAEWLVQNTPKDSVVFHADWDDFPELYFWDSHNRYVVGLDPTFLYFQDKKLYQEFVSITIGNTALPSSQIKNDFNSKYIFTDTGHNELISQISKDEHIKLRYSDSESLVYEITD